MFQSSLILSMEPNLTVATLFETVAMLKVIDPIPMITFSVYKLRYLSNLSSFATHTLVDCRSQNYLYKVLFHPLKLQIHAFFLYSADQGTTKNSKFTVPYHFPRICYLHHEVRHPTNSLDILFFQDHFDIQVRISYHLWTTHSILIYSTYDIRHLVLEGFHDIGDFCEPIQLFF